VDSGALPQALKPSALPALSHPSSSRTTPTHPLPRGHCPATLTGGEGNVVVGTQHHVVPVKEKEKSQKEKAKKKSPKRKSQKESQKEKGKTRSGILKPRHTSDRRTELETDSALANSVVHESPHSRINRARDRSQLMIFSMPIRYTHNP
jgi:hypothetical protein